jgi:hypothetical protein
MTKIATPRRALRYRGRRQWQRRTKRARRTMTSATAAAAPDPTKLREFKSAGFRKSKSSTPAANRSQCNLKNAAWQNQKALSIVWNLAPKAPLFKKKRLQKKDSEGNPIQFATNADGTLRNTVANRVLSAHTIRTLASGGAAVAAASLAAEAAKLRLDVAPESKTYPLLPSVSAGAAKLFEAAVVAYAQEGFGNAVAMKDELQKHTKPTARAVVAGFNVANRQLSNATGFTPPQIMVPIAKARKSKKEKRPKAKTPSGGEGDADA